MEEKYSLFSVELIVMRELYKMKKKNGIEKSTCAEMKQNKKEYEMTCMQTIEKCPSMCTY
jgi:hypothetical protein